MAENSKIEWTDHTFNAWVGCTKVSAACDHCYAESWAKRSGSPELWQGERRRTSVANWRKPLAWNAKAAKLGIRYRVFCCSLADVFDNQAPVEWRDDLWVLIRQTPSLDWLLLTKRPQNIARMLPKDWGQGYPNVWLGTTVEDQPEAERRIKYLINVPASIRFLSCEPLLGRIFVPRYGVHWIICGGESGGSARMMEPSWARDMRDQCAANDIPFFMKQMTRKAPIPPDLLVRQFPPAGDRE